jgi:hypothetical protein
MGGLNIPAEQEAMTYHHHRRPRAYIPAKTEPEKRNKQLWRGKGKRKPTLDILK